MAHEQAAYPPPVFEDSHRPLRSIPPTSRIVQASGRVVRSGVLPRRRGRHRRRPEQRARQGPPRGDRPNRDGWSRTRPAIRTTTHSRRALDRPRRSAAAIRAATAAYPLSARPRSFSTPLNGTSAPPGVAHEWPSINARTRRDDGSRISSLERKFDHVDGPVHPAADTTMRSIVPNGQRTPRRYGEFDPPR